MPSLFRWTATLPLLHCIHNADGNVSSLLSVLFHGFSVCMIVKRLYAGVGFGTQCILIYLLIKRSEISYLHFEDASLRGDGPKRRAVAKGYLWLQCLYRANNEMELHVVDREKTLCLWKSHIPVEGNNFICKEKTLNRPQMKTPEGFFFSTIDL